MLGCMAFGLATVFMFDLLPSRMRVLLSRTPSCES